MVHPAEQCCISPSQCHKNGHHVAGAASKRTLRASHRPPRIALGALHELPPNRSGLQPLRVLAQNSRVKARRIFCRGRPAPSPQRRESNLAPPPPGLGRTARHGSEKNEKSNDFPTKNENNELNSRALVQTRCLPPLHTGQTQTAQPHPRMRQRVKINGTCACARHTC